MFGDFMLLNLIVIIPTSWSWTVNHWPDRSFEIFILVNNLALILAQTRYSTVIHMRLIGAGDVLRRLMGLTVVQTVLSNPMLLIVVH